MMAILLNERSITIKGSNELIMEEFLSCEPKKLEIYAFLNLSFEKSFANGSNYSGVLLSNKNRESSQLIQEFND